MNHSVSDLVSSIKNGQMARKAVIVTSFSRMKSDILGILKSNGYIKDFKVIKRGNFDALEIDLAYHNGKAVVQDIKVISKPGKRSYAGVADIPSVYNGLGMIILSTPKGVLPDYEAKIENIGGELLLKIF